MAKNKSSTFKHRTDGSYNNAERSFKKCVSLIPAFIGPSKVARLVIKIKYQVENYSKK